jgi:hypothetical protein
MEMLIDFPRRGRRALWYIHYPNRPTLVASARRPLPRSCVAGHLPIYVTTAARLAHRSIRIIQRMHNDMLSGSMVGKSGPRIQVPPTFPEKYYGCAEVFSRAVRRRSTSKTSQV